MPHPIQKLLVLVAFTGVTLLSSAAEADLVKNGVSEYTVVLPAEPVAAERTAAKELVEALFQISGAHLPIVEEKDYAGGKMLAVGFNSRLPEKLRPAAFGTLAPEEVVIAADGDTLLIGGGRPRGVLYSAYEYLHQLGVRWYTPEATSTPKLKDIALPRQAYRYNPPIVSRSQLVGNAPTDAWSARNRLNSIRLWAGLADEYGGGLGQGPDMHTFSRMVSIPVLKAHPDWMAVVNGEREQPIGSTWGLCLSNPEVRSFLLARTLDWARKNPARKGVWVGQNDGSKYCTCEKCTAFYHEHGDKPSSLVVLLLNELAAALQKEMPDRTAKTLAYSWSMQAPSNMRVADNAIIMFSAPGTFSKAIETDADQAKLRAAIKEWGGIARNLEVYLYSSPWENYWFVEPSMYSGAANIQWAHQNGVNNIYTHVSGFGNTFGSEGVYLRGWVYARLCWDPTLDPKALIEDFVRGYYGPAANSVLKAIALTHSNVLDKDGKLRLYNTSEIVPNHLNPQSIRAVNLMYEKTYNSLTGPEQKKRFSLEWLPYLWTDFWLGFRGAGRYDAKTGTWSVPMEDGALRSHYGKLTRQFMIDNKIDVLKERRGLNPHKLSLDKMGVAWKATQLKGPHASAVVVPEVAGKITELRDSRTNFEPIKPYWGVLITEYPQVGSWRDLVNRDTVTAYTSNTGGADGLTLAANAGGSRVTKRVSMVEDDLNIGLSARPTKAGPLEISSSFMLDLRDEALGDHPTVYVEKRNGEWTKRVMGSETTFWYISDSIDLKDATGRVVIASEKRPEGLLLTLDMERMTRLDFEYDTYAKWPGDQGRMVWFSPMRSVKDVAAGQEISLGYQLRILPAVAEWMKVAGK